MNRLKEFNEKHIKDLQEVDGFVLQDVKGKTVAIGLDSEYPSTLDFIADYIDHYTASALALYLNFGSTRNMLHQIYAKTIFPFDDTHLKVRLMNAFDGISADDYAKKLEEKQWHLGDIVEDGKGHKAMIVLDDNLVYELMNVNVEDKSAFKVFSYFDVSDTLNKLQDGNPEWHKVNAKLVIE